MERLTKRAEYNCACWNGNQGHSTHRRYMEMLDRLAAYEDTGLEPEEIPQWIPAKDWLPNKSGTFIICTTAGDVFVAEYWHEREEFTRRDGSKYWNPVAYWQSLPQPPKGEKPC